MFLLVLSTFDMPTADESRATARADVRTSAVTSELMIRPSLKQGMDVLVSLLLALSIYILRCAALRCDPFQSNTILGSRSTTV